MVRAKPGKGSTSDLSMLSTGSKKPSKEEDSRLKLSINQLCWARTSPKTSQFWPAMVVDIDSIPEEVKATFRKVATLYAVRSFGEHFTYTQVTSLSCIKSWTQGVNDGSIELGKKSENFKKAVRMAQEELKVPAVQLLEDEYNKRVNEVESEFPDPDEDDALDREDQTAKNRRKASPFYRLLCAPIKTALVSDEEERSKILRYQQIDCEARCKIDYGEERE
uniref:PWWP domain-containing protein n=1 Tax=Plectus sambesii TaxID=2011161 RepID=A0A914XNW7_9BILA